MNVLRRFVVWAGRIFPALVLAIFTGTAGATITASFNSLQYDGFTGSLIASDAFNAGAGYDRDALHARTVWTFAKSAGAAENVLAEWRFQLIEEATGLPQPVVLADGSTGTTYTAQRTVSFSIGLIQQFREVAVAVDLVPAQRLLPSTRYRLRCQIFTSNGIIWLPGTTHEDSWERIWHFTEKDPAAGSATMALIESAVLERNNLIRSQPQQDSFRFAVALRIRRYDNWTALIPAITGVSLPTVVTLTNIGTSANLALVNPTVTASANVPEFSLSGGIRSPSETVVNFTFTVRPADWSTLDPVPLHRCSFSLRHSDETALELQRLTAFSGYLASLTGNLRCGAVGATFTSLVNDFAGSALAPTIVGYRARGPIAIPVSNARINGTNHTFTLSNQEMHMSAAGDLVLTDAAVVIPVQAPAAPDTQRIFNTRFERGAVTLSTAGAQCDGWKLHLPRGFGYVNNRDAQRRRLSSRIAANGTVGLTPSLLPPSNPTFSVATFGLRLVIERIPHEFTAPSLTFDLATGLFSFLPNGSQFLRHYQNTIIDGISPVNVANPAALRHHANEEALRHLNPAPGKPVSVSSTADDGTFINALSMIPEARAGFISHFPDGVSFSWDSTSLSSRGAFTITNDRVTTDSLIEGEPNLLVRYGRDCFAAAGCDPPAPTAGVGAVNCQVAQGRLLFTEGGGLLVPVTFPGHVLRWGTVTALPAVFSQNAGTFLSGTFHMPGNHLPWRLAGGAGDPAIAALPDDARPATLHFAAYNPATTEVPGTQAYTDGAGDYAGLNFRNPAATATCTSTIAGAPLGPYGLTAASKFYARPGGVSGKLESVPFSITRRIYGMDVKLENMRLAYLDSGNTDSAVGGSLTVGTNAAPNRASHFTLEFESLRFNCRGGLESADLKPSPDITLSYWGTLIRPQAIEFAQPGDCADAALGFLALGCQAKLPSLGGSNPWLAGTLGFRGADGSLVAKGDADAAGSGLTSRLKVPCPVVIDGPGTTDYLMTPCTEAYLNRWPGAGAEPLTGFANLAGTIDVPFFQALETHLHTASTPDPAVTANYLMGPADASGPLTVADFDPANSGSPPGVTVANYRKDFPANATRNWLGLVDFTFPVIWRNTERRFESPAPLTENLLVLTTMARVDALTPATADLSFGAEFQTGSSQLNVSSLFSELAGAGGSLIPLLSDELGIDFDDLLNDLLSLDALFADNLRGLVTPPLRTFTDPVADKLYAAVITEANSRTQLGLELSTLGLTGKPLRAAVQDVIGTNTGVPTGVVSIVSDLRTAAGDAARVLGVVESLSGLTGLTLPSGTIETLGQIDSTLALLQGDLSGLITSTASGALGSAIETAVAATAPWETSVQQALTALHDIHGANFATAFSGPGGKAAFREAFATAIMDQFLGSDPAITLLQSLRTHLNPLRDAVRDATDGLLGAINRAAADAAGALGAEIFSECAGVFAGAADPLDGPVQTAKLTGYARINGDSLSELRLDAKLLLKVPDDCKFEGSLLIRDLQSDTPGAACRAAAGAASDVTITAATSTSISGSPTDIEASLKVGLSAAGVPVGLAGRVGLAGKLDFEGLEVNSAELGAGFGANDAYLYGKAAGKTPEMDVEASLFLGKTCDIEVLRRADALIESALSQAAAKVPGSDFSNPTSANPIWGIYAYGYGSLSLNSILGIPSTCFLTIKAGAGSGYGVFYRSNSLAAVMRQRWSISGEVLCLADIGATLDLAAAAVAAKLPGQSLFDSLSNAAIAGKASANFTVEIGIDPFSVEYDKTFSLYFSLSGDQSPPLQLDFDL